MRRGVKVASVQGRRVCLVCCAVAAALAMAVTACSTSPNSYKTMTVKNRIANFSFEYRRFYNVAGPDVVSSPDLTYVQLLAPKKKVPMIVPGEGGKLTTSSVDYVPASIEVSASKTAPVSANDRVDQVLATQAKWPNYKFLERSPVVVSGIAGELVTYEVDWFGLFPRSQDDKPKLKHVVEAHFGTGGLNWTLVAESEPETAQVTRTDFDHVVQTFKINR